MEVVDGGDQIKHSVARPVVSGVNRAGRLVVQGREGDVGSLG